MTPLAWDTETFPITRAEPLPRVVCMSYAAGDPPEAGLLHHPDLPEAFGAMLADRDLLLVGHQTDYDLGVLWQQTPDLIGPIFRALDEGRVSDTKVREQLLAIADGSFEFRFKTAEQHGGFKLKRLASDYLGVELDKSEDGWRLRYGELYDVPLDHWPREAKDYATADAVSPLQIWHKQNQRDYHPPDETLQVRSQWCLKLMHAHGIVVDPAAVDVFEAAALERMIACQEQLVAEGIVRAKDGSRDLGALRSRIAAAYEQIGEAPPMSEGGDPDNPRSRGPQIQYGEAAVDPVAHLDDALMAAVRYAGAQKDLGFARAIRLGVDGPLHCDWNNLVETGRISCRATKIEDPETGKRSKDGFNATQMPRAPGSRECITARERNVLVVVDYAVAELRALAQVCYTWFKFSDLRDAFIAGKDPHVMLASSLMGIGYEEAAARKKTGDREVKMFRSDVAKHMNFGLAGGMGPDRFCEFVRKHTDNALRLHPDHSVTYHGREIPSARTLREMWKDQWSEIRPYFGEISAITGDFGSKTIEAFGSQRRRGGIGYCDACNGMFQSYVADVAKVALYAVTRACYAEPDSILYGCRPILFVHDELVLEAEEERAAEAAEECARIMLEIEQEWMPDVPAAVEAKLCRRWSKGADPVRDKRGRLIPWEDRER